MIELLSVALFIVSVVCIFLGSKLLSKSTHEEEARQRNDDIRNNALEMVERLAKSSTLNAIEIREAIAEQNTTFMVESDIWKMPLPYGKWEKFPDEKGRPEPEIRGFWSSYPGRLIGVKMPKGSEYDMHSHPWVEILIGGSGVVWVEIESFDGKITQHRLGPEDVVVIPSGARHAVLTAETESIFVCIWGIPK